MRDQTEEAIRLSPADARAMLRKGGWDGLTEAVAQAYVHASLMVVPSAEVPNILAFAAANPRAVPIIAVLPKGEWTTPLAEGGDIRTDVARYEVWENGVRTAELERIDHLWHDDLVAIFIGTTHILGMALKEAGIPADTVDNPRPAIYSTALEATPAGGLNATKHVTVKFARPEEVETVVRVSTEIPLGHGQPIAIGGSMIGVDGDHPAFGYPLLVEENRVPIFFECSYTLKSALQHAPVTWFACSAPGCSFITDVPWARTRNTTNIA